MAIKTKKINLWDSSKTVRENANALGLKLHSAYKWAYRYNLKFKRGVYVGGSIKPLRKDWIEPLKKEGLVK